MIYTIEVGWSSHEDLHAGRPDRRLHRVVLEAESYESASLTAALIVAYTARRRHWTHWSWKCDADQRGLGEMIPPSGMPTSTHYVE